MTFKFPILCSSLLLYRSIHFCYPKDHKTHSLRFFKDLFCYAWQIIIQLQREMILFILSQTVCLFFLYFIMAKTLFEVILNRNDETRCCWVLSDLKGKRIQSFITEYEITLGFLVREVSTEYLMAFIFYSLWAEIFILLNLL